jgi:hypothetical protein
MGRLSGADGLDAAHEKALEAVAGVQGLGLTGCQKL